MSRLLLVVFSLFVLTACQSALEEPVATKEVSPTEPKELMAETSTPDLEIEDQILLPTSTQSFSEQEATPIEPVAPDFILEDEYEMVTLLPFDAIPTIDDPQYYEVEEADQEYDPDELVIGIQFNGEARAYSVPLLSRHEIVNDIVGEVKLSVTW